MKTANKCEYKVDNNANIANFVRMRKSRMLKQAILEDFTNE